MTTFTSEDRQAAEQARPTHIAIGTIRPFTEHDEDRPFEIWNGSEWVELTIENAARLNDFLATLQVTAGEKS